MRPIDADALSKTLGEWWGIPKDWDGSMDKLCEDAFCAIDEAETLDLEPVRHGRWTTGRHCYECSMCGHGYLGMPKTHYCPDCGAKMDGEAKE